MNQTNRANSTATKAAPVVGEFKCDKCGKSFDKQNALSMHKVRVHTRAGKEGWRLAINQSHRVRSKLLKQKRESYERRKAEFASRGLNARGEPFASTLAERRQSLRQGQKIVLTDPASAKRREYQAKLRARYAAEGLTSKGTPRKREYNRGAVRAPSRKRENMRAYQQRHYWTKRAQQGHPVPPDKQHLLMANGVQPEPQAKLSPTFRQALADELQCANAETAILHAISKLKKLTSRRRAIWCPMCGTNMQNVETSVNFGGE